MEDPSDQNTSLFQWLAALRDGGSQAAEKLWQRYFERMVLVARRKLAVGRRGGLDEEDIALSAFKSFCLGFTQGRFPSAQEDANLWPLLVTLTLNKAIDHLRRETRLKRGGDREPLAAEDWNTLANTDPSPELLAAANESFENLLIALDRTGDPTLREITLDSISGLSTAEIAAKLGCTQRTVQRKMYTIRNQWEVQHP